MSESYVGAVAPELYQMDITPGHSGLDLSTVTSAQFKVLKPDGTILTWTATRSNQTSSTLRLRYAFSGTTELDIAGVWYVYGLLTIPSGKLRTNTAQLWVKPTYFAP